MSNELPLPDHLRNLLEKRTDGDRRQKPGHQPAAFDDGSSASRRQLRERRQPKKYRQQLTDEDGE